MYKTWPDHMLVRARRRMRLSGFGRAPGYGRYLVCGRSGGPRGGISIFRSWFARCRHDCHDHRAEGLERHRELGEAAAPSGWPVADYLAGHFKSVLEFKP